MAVGRHDSATRAVGDTATASQAAIIVVTRAAIGERGHGNLIKAREGAAATQPPSPSEVHALGRLTEEDGERRLCSELKDGGGFFVPGSKKPVPLVV